MLSLRESTACKGAARVLSSRSGQSTVEFAIVAAAFIAVIIALGSLGDLIDSGALVEHAVASASHMVGSGDAGAWGDVLLY